MCLITLCCVLILECHRYEFQPKYEGERIGQDPGKSAQNKRTANKETVKAGNSQKQSQDTRKDKYQHSS